MQILGVAAQHLQTSGSKPGILGFILFLSAAAISYALFEHVEKHIKTITLVATIFTAVVVSYALLTEKFTNKTLEFIVFFSGAIIGYAFADQIVKYTDISKGYSSIKQWAKREPKEVSNG